VVSGRIAGDRMAGGGSRYGLQSMFWSDLENVGVSFTAVGRVERELETVAFWNLDSPPFEYAPSGNSYTAGVVWYIRHGVVVGAVLWNLNGRKYLDAARNVIAAKSRMAADVDLDSLIALPKAPFKSVVRTRALDESSEA
jgi:NADPH-dependent 2,4-dienoyl-CoA reductase/sulfur reductase-like enzyme